MRDLKTIVLLWEVRGGSLSFMPRVTEEYRRAQASRILDAAEARFARNGFHATSMDEIIAEAGMSSSTVYRYFPGKREIIRAVTGRRMDPALETLRRLAAQEDAPAPGPAVAEILDILAPRRPVGRGASAGQDAPAVTTALVVVNGWAETARDAELAAAMRANLAEVRRLVGDLVRVWQRAGRITDAVDADALASLLVRIVLGQVAETAVEGDSAASLPALLALLAP